MRDAVTTYTDCLRQHGVEVSGPDFDNAGNVTRWPDYQVNASVRGAEKACARPLKKVAFQPSGADAAFIHRAQAFADCMRRNGITDIHVSVEGIRLDPGDHTRKEIRDAQKACESLMTGL